MTLKATLRLLQQIDDKGGGDGGGGNAPAPGPSPAPPPAPSGWHSDAHKDYVANKGFKTGDDALTSLQHLEKLLGAEKAGRTLVRPKDDKDVEGTKAWRAGIGVPEKADDYGLPVPEGESPEFSKTVSGWLHELGVPKDQGVKLATKWNEYVQGVIKESDAALKAESDTQLQGLKDKLGDKFPATEEQARRFAKASGWDDAKVSRYEQAFGTATFIKDFAALGAKLGEAGFTKGDGFGGGGMTPQQAKDRITVIKAERVAGRMSQNDFLSEMDTLGPLAEKAA